MFRLEDRIADQNVVAVLSTTAGISILARLNLRPGVLIWVYEWFLAYFELRRDEGIDEPEFSFFYLVPGRMTGVPNGLVDGVEVLEAGFGGESLGPAEGFMIPISQMLAEFGEALNIS